jgi:kinesin family protein C1
MQKKQFPFERVIGPDEEQDNLFQEVLDSVEEAARGGRACIIAYGQTGSGKTYSMKHLIEKSFQVLSETCDSNVRVSVSCVEIYNEMVKDLLGEDKLSKSWKDVLASSTRHMDQDWDAALALVQGTAQRRATKFTDSNEQSSRSHAIYTIKVKGKKLGQVQFVDLAGSERINKSGVRGDT